MPFSVAHGLVGASVVAAAHPRPSLKDEWQALLFGAFLAIAPDFDFILVRALHYRGYHRAFTHSIMFALAAGCLMLAVLGKSRLREAIIYTAALLSHGLLDFASTRIGGGVELLWPFTTERFKLGLVSLSEIGFKYHGVAGAIKELFKISLFEFLLFAPALLALLLLRRWRWRASRDLKG